MAGPEATIERQIVKEAKAAGWTVRKLAFLDCRGAPDRLFGRGGECILIEFKRPGEVATIQQRKRHRELHEEFGLRCETVNSLFLGRALLHLWGQS